MLSILRRRAGEPVTYAELQAAGIEFPASLVSELELAGVEIERCHSARPGERPVRAVRLPSPARTLEEMAAKPPRGRAPEIAAPAVGQLAKQPRRTRKRGAVVPVARGELGSEPHGVVESELDVPRAAGIGGWGPVRVYRRSPGGALAVAGARLAPGSNDGLLSSPSAPARSRRRASARVVAAVALLAAIAVTLAVILAGTSGGKTDPRLTAQHHPRTQRAKAHSRARGTSATSRAHHETAQGQTTSTGRHTTTASPQAPRLPATPVSPSRASALEARGHNVLAAGQYATAVRILERAVAATGEHLSSCLEPTTENCLTYAYALFDLGRALLLSGHHSSAVAVLERRLQIDNQRPEVAAQLALARQG